MKKVGIVMGSDSDLPVVRKAVDMLRSLDIPFEVHVYSAHRTPAAAADFARDARKNGFGVLIAAAGMAAHLAGAIAANTTLPVIGIPCQGPCLGIPVATVAVGAGANAALLAAQMLALSDPDLTARLEEKRGKDAAAVLEKDAGILARL